MRLICTAGSIPVLVGKLLPYFLACLMLQVHISIRCTEMLLFPVCRDTAGQERYASLANLYYRGANAACIVFEITICDIKARSGWATLCALCVH